MPSPSTAMATIAVFDLDRTVTREGTYTPFLLSTAAGWLAMAWTMLRGLAAGLTYKAGLIARSQMKARMLALTIAGAPRVQVTGWAEVFVDRWLKTHVRPGAVEAIARHRAAGDHLVLATASFDFYATVFARRLGFDHVIATGSVWMGDCLQASVDGENCYGADKLKAVRAYIETLPSPRLVVAYSDHHTDFELLRWADEGVAVNPNRKLRIRADAAGLAIVDWN
jgi:phosphatidylglycerophosphatase C